MHYRCVWYSNYRIIQQGFGKMETMVKFNEDYSTKDKDYLKDAINFYLDQMNFEDFDAKLYINFTDNLPVTSVITSDDPENQKMYNRGLCKYISPDLFLVSILSTQNHEHHIKTLFHELCHVHQYVSGKQKIDNYGRTIWNNSIPYPKSQNTAYQDYLNLPWEIEAREHEEIYYAKWREVEKRMNKKKLWYVKLLDKAFNTIVYCVTSWKKDTK